VEKRKSRAKIREPRVEKQEPRAKIRELRAEKQDGETFGKKGDARNERVKPLRFLKFHED
jgi:hypothetical protein